MPRGTLEVLLVGAKGLENTDFLSNMDPYAILKCRTRAKKQCCVRSSYCWQTQAGKEEELPAYHLTIPRAGVTLTIRPSGKGSDPEWNETFIFTISDPATDLIIKLMDSDALTEDDFVGEVTISLEPLFMEGSLPPTVYNVVKDEKYCGELKVGLTFTPEEYHGRSHEEENYGGWKVSS